MAIVYFVSHPEVDIDRSILVPHWDLSDHGRARLQILLTQPWIPTVTHVFSSMEQKAKTTAQAIAEALDVQVQYVAGLAEMDRSSTGVLEPDEFNEVVEAFFANPDLAIRGWERASDAQRRVSAAVEYILAQTPEDATIAMVSHGGVGTLLLTQLKHAPISRAEDQPGQGHYFVFATRPRRLMHGWRPIDLLPVP